MSSSCVYYCDLCTLKIQGNSPGIGLHFLENPHTEGRFMSLQYANKHAHWNCLRELRKALDKHDTECELGA
jgi:hypothetical protein